MNSIETSSLGWLGEEEAEIAAISSSTHQGIAALAHSLWHARGCPQGSPEIDWLQAEQQYLESFSATRPKAMAAEA